MADPTPLEEVRRGHAVARLLADADIQAVFAEEREKLRNEWEGALTTEAREEKFHALQGWTRFVTRLRALAAGGEYAQGQLDAEARRAAGASRRSTT